MYGNFVFFLCFYEIAEFICCSTFTPSHRESEQYKYAYCATLLFSIVLRFGVIDRFHKNLFANPISEDGSEASAAIVTVSFVVCLLVVYAPEVIRQLV